MRPSLASRAYTAVLRPGDKKTGACCQDRARRQELRRKGQMQDRYSGIIGPWLRRRVVQTRRVSEGDCRGERSSAREYPDEGDEDEQQGEPELRLVEDCQVAESIAEMDGRVLGFDHVL